jgi:hypothetical protein
LQYFVQDEAFSLEQVAIGIASGCDAPVPYLLMELRESKQCAQGFLARNRFEDAVALLQRRAGVGRRCFPVNSGWIRTHACAVSSIKNLCPSYPGPIRSSLPLLVQPGSTGQAAPLSAQLAYLGAHLGPYLANEGPELPISSVIVFGWVPQCPLVHVLSWVFCGLGMLKRRRPSRHPGDAPATTLKILPSASIQPIFERHLEAVPGDLMTDRVDQEKPEKLKKSSWWWPGVVASSLAGAAVVAFRGCWHRKMSWPVRSEDCSYQVCLGCGIKRLFDEKEFRSYGPYHYDLSRLTAARRSHPPPSVPLSESSWQRPAS